MEKKIRITGTSKQDLMNKVYEHFKAKMLDVYKAKNIVINNMDIYIKSELNSELIAYKGFAYADAAGFNIRSDSWQTSILRISVSEMSAPPWSVDIVSNEGNGYYHFKRATMSDDTVPVSSSAYGAIAYAPSIDDLDEIYMGAVIGNDSITKTYKGYANTFWNLSNFAIPQGQIALFNPGNGHHFFKDVYRHSANIAGLTIPEYSYQEIAGLGRFFILPGPLWIKEA